MQPVVVSSARRQDLWEAGGMAIEVVAVEGMVVVAVEGMVVVAVEGMELCPPGRSQNAYHMGVSARLIISPPRRTVLSWKYSLCIRIYVWKAAKTGPTLAWKSPERGPHPPMEPAHSATVDFITDIAASAPHMHTSDRADFKLLFLLLFQR